MGEFYGDVDPDLLRRSSHHEAAEAAIRELAAAGRAVVLGRAGAVVLADDPRALHVRLDGPPEARLRQAMRLEEIDRETAKARMKQTDRAREAYVKRYYRCDARDPSLYDMVLDATRLELEVCVEVIAAACAAPVRRPSMPPASPAP
jgi:cytidylate kinase